MNLRRYFAALSALFVLGSAVFGILVSIMSARAASTASVVYLPLILKDHASPVSVSLQNNAYAPDPVTIRVGTKVVWTNDESLLVPHTVTSGLPLTPNGIFDSGTLDPGQSFEFTFNSVGTFPYFCGFHGATMTGTVNVVP